MRKLSTCAATLAFFFLAPNGPAKAQVALESAYAQPADMVDGFDAGSRFMSELRYGSTSFAETQSPRAGAPGDRHSMPQDRPGARGDRRQYASLPRGAIMPRATMLMDIADDEA